MSEPLLPASMPIITPTDIRAYLGQVKQATDTDALLADIAVRAESIVTEALGFAFDAYAAATARDVAHATSSMYFRLPTCRSGSVTSVARIDRYAMTTEATVAVSDWREQSKGYLYRSAGWPAAWYRVTAQWGYGPPPPAITEVVMELAVNIWRSKEKGSFTEMIGPDGGGQVRVVGGLTKQQRDVIASVQRRYTEAAY